MTWKMATYYTWPVFPDFLLVKSNQPLKYGPMITGSRNRHTVLVVIFQSTARPYGGKASSMKRFTKTYTHIRLHKSVQASIERHFSFLVEHSERKQKAVSGLSPQRNLYGVLSS